MRLMWACVFLVFLFFLVSGCNIFNPFYSKSSPNDFLEDGLNCLHDNDLDCAVANYEALPEGALRNQRLCTAYLSRAGFTLDAYLKTVYSPTNIALGVLAGALIPWHTQKSEDALKALTYCAFVEDRLGAFLQSVSLVIRCAVQMAKTDSLVALTINDTECSTPGDRSGSLTRSDIIGTGRMMCPADALICRDSFLSDSFANLRQSGYGDLATLYDNLPANLKDSAATPAIAILALYNTVPE